MNNYDSFKKNALAVQAVIEKISSPAQAIDYIEKLFLQNNFSEKTLAVPKLKEEWANEDFTKLKKNKIEILTDKLRQYPQGFDVGLTSTNFGIADTGTLVIDSSSEDIRLATMMSKIHVAVLKENSIKKNSEEAQKELTELFSGESSYTAFITGASRTADIERILALGVHGPLELHILVLEGV